MTGWLQALVVKIEQRTAVRWSAQQKQLLLSYNKPPPVSSHTTVDSPHDRSPPQSVGEVPACRLPMLC